MVAVPGVALLALVLLLVLSCHMTPLVSSQPLLHRYDPNPNHNHNHNHMPLNSLAIDSASRLALHRSLLAPISVLPGPAPSSSRSSSSSPFFSPPSSSSLSSLLASSNCSVSASWQLAFNSCEPVAVTLTPDCQLLYVTLCDYLEPNSYIASIDLPTGAPLWRVPFPYNSMDTWGDAPFFQLNSAGSLLLAEHLLVSDPQLCVEMWGVAVARPAGKVVWKVSQCIPPQLYNDTEIATPFGLLFPGAASDGDDIVLSLPSTFAVLDLGNDTVGGYFLPWSSIKASTGAVLHEQVVNISAFGFVSSVQSDGRYFSVQGEYVSGNTTEPIDVTAVFSMSDKGVFAQQSMRAWDFDTTIACTSVTASDTLMQGFVDSSGSASGWVGWTVPEQKQRWQRSDDALLMWQWPSDDAYSAWLWIDAHSLNSSWSIATALGANPAGPVWVIVTIYEPHTGNRIATSAILGPQEADDSGDVDPRPARIIATDAGPRLVQVLQQGVYVLDAVSLELLYSGEAAMGEDDVDPYIVWMEGAAAARLQFDYDTLIFQASTMQLNASSGSSSSSSGRLGPVAVE